MLGVFSNLQITAATQMSRIAAVICLLIRFGSLDPPKHRKRVLCFGGRI